MVVKIVNNIIKLDGLVLILLIFGVYLKLVKSFMLILLLVIYVVVIKKVIAKV